jgi:hypothetical protein
VRTENDRIASLDASIDVKKMWLARGIITRRDPGIAAPMMRPFSAGTS